MRAGTETSRHWWVLQRPSLATDHYEEESVAIKGIKIYMMEQ